MLLMHRVGFIHQESFGVSSQQPYFELYFGELLQTRDLMPEAEINFLPEQKFSQLGSTILLEQSARWTTQDILSSSIIIIVIIIIIVGLVIIRPHLPRRSWTLDHPSCYFQSQQIGFFFIKLNQGKFY